jgi:hypothetical protein
MSGQVLAERTVRARKYHKALKPLSVARRIRGKSERIAAGIAIGCCQLALPQVREWASIPAHRSGLLFRATCGLSPIRAPEPE